MTSTSPEVADPMAEFAHLVSGDTWHNRVWTILVEEAGAYDTVADRHSFAIHFPKCREYRFMGRLGFGGKVWLNGNHDGNPYINCYSEDATPERQEIIDRTNARLAERIVNPRCADFGPENDCRECDGTGLWCDPCHSFYSTSLSQPTRENA